MYSDIRDLGAMRVQPKDGSYDVSGLLTNFKHYKFFRRYDELVFRRQRRPLTVKGRP